MRLLNNKKLSVEQLVEEINEKFLKICTETYPKVLKEYEKEMNKAVPNAIRRQRG